MNGKNDNYDTIKIKSLSETDILGLLLEKYISNAYYDKENKLLIVPSSKKN